MALPNAFFLHDYFVRKSPTQFPSYTSRKSEESKRMLNKSKYSRYLHRSGFILRIVDQGKEP